MTFDLLCVRWRLQTQSLTADQCPTFVIMMAASLHPPDLNQRWNLSHKITVKDLIQNRYTEYKSADYLLHPDTMMRFLILTLVALVTLLSCSVEAKTINLKWSKKSIKASGMGGKRNFNAGKKIMNVRLLL